MFRVVGSLILLVLSGGFAAAADRSIDGSGNSTGNRGAVGEVFPRIGGAVYADGLGSPVAGRPNARNVTNAVCAQDGSVPNTRRGSDYIWQWGQFIDHDVTLAETEPGEPFDIEVLDVDDPLYVAGHPFIPLSRTEHVSDPGGVRQQVNRITSFIDGSMVYGSDGVRAALLREGSGGRMRIGADGLLPFNTTSEPNATIGLVPDEELRIAGDIRANEQPCLLALHTIFVREHNRIAAALVELYPAWTDEQVYQRARKLVGAMIQAITYYEWLPALLGPEAPDPGSFSYNPATDPGVLNEFSTALFRLGHTLVSPKLMRVGDDGAPDDTAWVPLRDAYFNPVHTATPEAVDMVLKGMACQLHQNADPLVIDDLRDFLFGAPGSGGMDLAALNIQRGREHGLPDYNLMRVLFGLPPVVSFTQVTSDPQMQAALGSVYPSLMSVDPWVGALAEDHVPGAAVGSLLARSFALQFQRMAEGDAFFFQWDDDLLPAEREVLAATRLGDVIERNSNLSSMQENVFFVPDEGPMEIMAMTRSAGGEVSLFFMAGPGYEYHVKYSDDLVSWQDDLEGGLMDSGDSVLMMRCVDPEAAVMPKRFYRVERVEK